MLQLIIAILIAEILERLVELLWGWGWRRYKDYRRGKPTQREQVVAFVYGLLEKSKATFFEIEAAAKLKYKQCDGYHSLRQANEIVNKLGLK